MARGAKTGGRKKGTPNKTTAAIKDAMMAVYADLQDTVPDRDHGHFFEWAKGNPTEYYRLASKLIPIQVGGSGEPIEVITRIELIDGDGTD